MSLYVQSIRIMCKLKTIYADEEVEEQTLLLILNIDQSSYYSWNEIEWTTTISVFVVRTLFYGIEQELFGLSYGIFKF